MENSFHILFDTRIPVGLCVPMLQLNPLQRSVDRRARAWMDALQTQAKKLPALEHQKIEL